MTSREEFEKETGMSLKDYSYEKHYWEQYAHWLEKRNEWVNVEERLLKKDMKMCNCINIDIGSFANQMMVHAPAHMQNKTVYCLDRCIAEEVMLLWIRGITTTGCCCGHNKKMGYIGVIESDIQKMKELGYKTQFNKCRPDDEDSFYPKSITPPDEAKRGRG